jgi:signal transduction histidine kinase
LTQGNGSFPKKKLDRLTQLADDLRMLLASHRAALKHRGKDFRIEITRSEEQISVMLDEFKETFAEYEIERNNLEALSQIGQVINSSLDLKTVLSEVVDTIIRLTGAERAFLMLHEPQEDLRIVTARNWRRESLLPHEYELSQTIAMQVMAEGKAIVTTNAVSDPRFSHHTSVITYSLRSILCVPLVVKGKPTGVIYADNRIREGLFTEKDCRLLSAFANQAAVAIENAQLYEAIRRHADELEARVKERTTELAEANRHLRALSKLKDEFVANVSHELRTPISSLKLYGALLEQPKEKSEQYIAAVKREISRLEHIIESLLRLSSFDQNQIAVNLAPLDLRELAETLVQDRMPLANSRNLSLFFESASERYEGIVDRELITEALSILLTNAFNYTPAGGKIQVKLEPQIINGKTWIAIQVADSGPGISEEERSQLFQRFFRGKAGRESGISGTGLGLAIAKEIIVRNRGEIEVHEKGLDGKGTGFTIRVPAIHET